MTTVSSLVVQRRLASLRQVEEALARQVLYGGDVVTNLLEVAPPPATNERELTRALGEALGIGAADVDAMRVPDADAVAKVPRAIAEEHGFVPIAMQQGEGGAAPTLVVALAEPLAEETAAQVRAVVGSALTQVAAPQARLRQALERAYGVPMDRRSKRLVAQLDGERQGAASSPPAAGSFPRASFIPELPDDPLAAPPPNSIRPPKSKPPPQPAMGKPTDILVVEPPTGSTRPPPATTIRTSHPGPAALQWFLRSAQDRASAPNAQLPPPGPTPPTDEPVRGDDAPPAAQGRARRAQRRRRGPFTLDEAKRTLEGATTADVALGTVVEFAQQYVVYLALFLVHEDLAEGWDARGPGASGDRVRKMGVPLDLPSLFATAREQRAPIVRPRSDDGLDAVIATDLDRPRGGDVLIAPIAVGKRVVALLCADDGAASMSFDDLRDVLAVVSVAGAALARIIVRRKKKSLASKGSAESIAPAPPAEEPPPPSERSPASRRAIDAAARARALASALMPASSGSHAPRAGSTPPPIPRVAKVSQPGLAALMARTSESQSRMPLPDPAPMLEAPRIDAPRVDTPPPPSAPPYSSISDRPDPRASVAADRLASLPLAHEPEGPTPAPGRRPTDPYGIPAQRPGASSVARLDLKSIPQPIDAPAPQRSTEKGVPTTPLGLEILAKDLLENRAENAHAGRPESAIPIALTRRPFGPPIPREEPDGAPPTKTPTPQIEIAVSLTPSARPAIASETDADAPAPGYDDPSASRPSGPELVEAAEVTDEELEELLSVSEAPMRDGERLEAYPPRPPPRPSVHLRAAELPKVMVAIDPEYALLVARTLKGGEAGERAATRLRELGGAALSAIMERFPGPTRCDRTTSLAQLPSPNSAGPLLALLCKLGRLAHRDILARVGDPVPETRFWATYLLTEIVDLESAGPLLPRIVDDDLAVRRVAALAARALLQGVAGAAPRVIDPLVSVLLDFGAPASLRLRAAHALGELHEGRAVEGLILGLESEEREIADACHVALKEITRHDPTRGEISLSGMVQPATVRGRSTWPKWFAANAGKHRIEWLIDALMDDEESVREAAGAELKALTKVYFGYYPNLPRLEREAAQQRYLAWWQESGRAKFSPDADEDDAQ